MMSASSPGEEGLRIGAVLEDEAHERLPALPSDRRDQMGTLFRERRDDVRFVPAAFQEQRPFVPDPGVIQELPAAVPDLSRVLELFDLPEAAQQEEPFERICVDGKSRPSFRQILERSRHASREREIRRHRVSPRIGSGRPHQLWMHRLCHRFVHRPSECR